MDDPIFAIFSESLKRAELIPVSRRIEAFQKTEAAFSETLKYIGEKLYCVTKILKENHESFSKFKISFKDLVRFLMVLPICGDTVNIYDSRR